jgi:acetyl-CoA carboxylase alpha subunit
MVRSLKEAVTRHLREIETLPIEELLDRRYRKFRKMGEFLEEAPPSHPAPVK